VYDLVFCVIAQGGKEVFLGSERYLYDAARYLIVTANLPVAVRVLEASQERPYLSLRLKLDPLLVRSLESPGEARFLATLITREIVYWLLNGEQCDRLRYIVVQNGHAQHIARAIERFRRDFDQSLSIERVAQDLGMSVSSFHNHFKAVTAMIPLQFQKRLRLQEARRLLLSEDIDAASAAFRVGYQDASLFSREYKGLFGCPPMRDVQRLRGATADAFG
jgi:AraC-like DNA-binding protein